MPKKFGFNDHGILEWRYDPPVVEAMDSGTPTYAISNWQWYQAGTGTTVDNQTALANENTGITVGTGGDLAFATAAHIRLQYDETNLGDPANYDHSIYFKIGVAGTPVELGTTTTTGVTYATDSVWTDGDATTQILSNPASGGSFVAGVGHQGNATYLNTSNFAQNDYTEYVACVQFIEADLNHNDVVYFGIYNEGTAGYEWSSTATATISKQTVELGAASVSLTLTASPRDGSLDVERTGSGTLALTASPRDGSLDVQRSASETLALTVLATPTVEALELGAASETLAITASASAQAEYSAGVSETLTMTANAVAGVVHSASAAVSLALTTSATAGRVIAGTLPAQSPAVLSNAVAWWHADRYDPDTDTQWEDQSGNGHHAQFGSTSGADTNDPTFLNYQKYGEAGIYRPGYAGTGGGIWQANAHTVFSGVTDMEIQFDTALFDWISGSTQVFVHLQDTTNTRTHFQFGIDGSGNLFFKRQDSSGTTVTYTSTAAVSFTDGDRRKLRVQFDLNNGSSQSQCDFYWRVLDGDTWTQLGTSVTNANTTASSAYAAATMFIGDTTNTGNTPMDGIFWHIKIWSDLTESTLEHWSDIPNDMSVAAANYTESSSNAATVTIHRLNAPEALFVDRNMFAMGGDDYFEVADHADLNFGTSDSFTAAVFFHKYDNITINSAMYLSKAADESTNIGYCVTVQSGEKPRITFSDGTNVAADQWEPTGVTRDRHTAIGVRNTADDDCEVFVDGTGTGTPFTDPTTGTLANALPLRFGASAAGTPVDYVQGGAVIAYAIFRSALSDADIATLDTELKSDLTAGVLSLTINATAVGGVSRSAVASETLALTVNAVGTKETLELGAASVDLALTVAATAQTEYAASASENLALTTTAAASVDYSAVASETLAITNSAVNSLAIERSAQADLALTTTAVAEVSYSAVASETLALTVNAVGTIVGVQAGAAAVDLTLTTLPDAEVVHSASASASLALTTSAVPSRVVEGTLPTGPSLTVLPNAVAWWHADYHDPDVDTQWLDQSGNGHHAQLGSTSGADTNDPLFLPYIPTNESVGIQGLGKPESCGSYLNRRITANPTNAKCIGATEGMEVIVDCASQWGWFGNQSYVYGMGVTDTAAGNPTHSLLIQASGQVYMFRRKGGANSYYISNANLPLGSWSAWDRKQLRVTVDNATGAANFYYRNPGESWTQLGTQVTGDTGAADDNGDALVLGQKNNGDRSKGYIFYDFKIYDAASGGTLQFHCDFTNPATLPVGASSYTDLSSNAYTVSIFRGTAAEPVVVNRNLWYYTTDDYHEVADHSDLELYGTDFTAAIAFRKITDQTYNTAFLTKGNSYNQVTGWGLVITSGGSEAGTFTIDDAGGTAVFDVYGTYPDSQEHTIVGRYNNTTYAVEVGKDGTMSGSPAIDRTFDDRGTVPLRIGASEVPNKYLNGVVVSAAIFRSALSDANIATLHTELLADHTASGGPSLTIEATAAGTVQVTELGAASVSLALTTTAASSLEVTNSASVSASLTASASAEVTHSAAADETLALTATAVATLVGIQAGAAAVDLTLTTTAAPSLEVTSAVDQNLTLSTTAIGQMDLGATADSTLAITVAATGTLGGAVEGAASETLALTAVGAGSVERTASASQTLVLTATSTPLVERGAVSTVTAVMTAGAVPTMVFGASASVVGTITVVAVPTVTSPYIKGQASVTLALTAAGILSYVPDWTETITIVYQNFDTITLVTEDNATISILPADERSITLKISDEGIWE